MHEAKELKFSIANRESVKSFNKKRDVIRFAFWKNHFGRCVNGELERCDGGDLETN